MSLAQVMDAIDGVEKDIRSYRDKTETKLREFSDELLQLKQRGAPTPPTATTPAVSPFATAVLKAVRDNSEMIAKAPSVRMEVKAAADALTTSVARTIVSGPLGVVSGAALGVQNALSMRPVGATSAIEYSRYLALEGAAAKQSAEGAAKAAVRPTFSLITETAATIAGYTKLSKQALNDSAALMGAVDVTLRRSIATALDAFLTGGTWGGAAGLLAHATAATSTVYANLADAVSEGVATMQTAGFSPSAVVMTPADWLAIITATASGSGEYLSGAYLAALPENLRGLRVVLSPTITAGKALIVDGSLIELLVVEDMTVEIGTDADDFTKNLRTVLGELRVIPTFNAVGAARLITSSA